MLYFLCKIISDKIMEKQKYKFDAIFWDIGNTLLNLEYQRYAMKKCFKLFNLGKMTEDIFADYKEINDKYWDLFAQGELSKSYILVERFNELFKKYNLDVNSEIFNHKYLLSLGDKVKYNDNSFKILKDLKGKIKQYALTDGTMLMKEKQLKNAKLYDVLDNIFISEKIGSCKPNIEFFNYVFENIPNFEHDRILIVGDGLKTDMLGDNNAKIKTCYYNPRHKPAFENIKINYTIENLNQIYDIIKET